MPRFFPESDLIKFLNQIDEDASFGRGDVAKRMEENIKAVKGNQWKGSPAPYFLCNVIQDAVEDKIGKLSESKPRIRVMPTRDGLGDAAKTMEKSISSVWDTSRFEYKTEKIGYYGSLSGVSFVSSPFNPRLNNGNGDVQLIVRDPRFCGVDRHISGPDDTDQGEYVVMQDYQPLDLIRSLYPGRGALVEAEGKMEGFEAPKIMTPVEIVKGAYDRLTGKKDQEPKGPIPRAYFKAYYIQDRRRSMEDLGILPITKLTKWAEKGIPFPGGRRIIRAGDVVLEDTWNPYWDGLYPLDMLSWKVDLESIFGPDEIQGVKKMQEAVNRLGDAYTRNSILNSVIRYIMDPTAMSPEERNKLSNEAAQIIEVRTGLRFEAVVPPTLPVDVINFVSTLMEWIRQKIGVTQPPTQKRVPSIVTGPAIEGLQLMIETPIRTAARRLEDFYERIGQKLIARIYQYFTADRTLHLVGENNKWVEFEFVRRNLIADERGRPRSEEDIRKIIQERAFHFRIEPGSSLAITRVQRAMMKYQLASQGWLHPREVLEELGFENPDEKLAQAKEAIESGLINLERKDRRTGPTAGGELPVNAEGLAA